jgi:hypothetical protein
LATALPVLHAVHGQDDTHRHCRQSAESLKNNPDAFQLPAEHPTHRHVDAGPQQHGHGVEAEEPSGRQTEHARQGRGQSIQAGDKLRKQDGTDAVAWLAGLHFGCAGFGLAEDFGNQPDDRASLPLSKIEPNAVAYERCNECQTESGWQAELVEARESSGPDQEGSRRHR